MLTSNSYDELSNPVGGPHPARNNVERFVSNGPVERQIITRSHRGIFKPNPRYALTTSYSSLNEPRNVKEALQHPLWVDGMRTDSQALEHGTWYLVHLIYI